eukprot:3646373-Pleurochrysis_carterae.AAC.1
MSTVRSSPITIYYCHVLIDVSDTYRILSGYLLMPTTVAASTNCPQQACSSGMLCAYSKLV